LQPGAFASPDVVEVLQAVLREFPGALTLLWDRLPAHRSGHTQAALESFVQPGRLQVEWLPAYAPELNPVEYLWGHLDGGVMANYAPSTLAELHARLQHGARKLHRRQSLLQGFLKASGLFS
jgi:transposase